MSSITKAIICTLICTLIIVSMTGCVKNVTPTPSPTVYITLVPSPTPTKLPTPTPSPTPSPTVTPRPTATPTPTTPPYGSYQLSGSHINPNTQIYFNPAGSPPGTLGALQAAMNTWDAKIPAVIFKPLITGNSKPCQADGINTIGFGPLDMDTLAETWCWGNSEEDMIFNSNYAWGIDPDGEGPIHLPYNTLDIQNTATHEFGHVVGLNDIYNTAFEYVTMFGAIELGETYQDSLSPSDIYAVQQIYGA